MSSCLLNARVASFVLQQLADSPRRHCCCRPVLLCLCLASQAEERGADAVLVVTPAYVKPSQRGLVEFYTMVADRGGLPVVLYNVSGSWPHPTYLVPLFSRKCGDRFWCRYHAYKCPDSPYLSRESGIMRYDIRIWYSTVQ